MSAHRARIILVKLKLLEMNDIAGAEKLDEIQIPVQIFDEDSKDVPAESRRKDLEAILKAHEERYNAYIKVMLKSNGEMTVPLAVKAMQRDVIDHFQRTVMGIQKCENCQTTAVSYRKDGPCKLFQRPLSKRAKNALGARRLTMKVCSHHVYFECCISPLNRRNTILEYFMS